MRVPSFEEVLFFTYEIIKNEKSTGLTQRTLLKKVIAKYPELNISKNIAFDLDPYYSSTKGWLDKPKVSETYPENFASQILKEILDILVWSGYLMKSNNQYLINLKNNLSEKSCFKNVSEDRYKSMIIIKISKIIDMISFLNINEFSYEKNSFRKPIQIELDKINLAFYEGNDKFLQQLREDALKTYDDFYENGSKKLQNLSNLNRSKLSFELEKVAKLEQENKILNEKIAVMEQKNIELPNGGLFKISLEENLLSSLKKISPIAFEKFSLQLIKSIAKERGGEVEVFHNGQVGDGGVDGIIESERTFGRSKERVFVQCKRYDKTAIGRPEMQAFAGAMLVEKIHTGIFITTSYFSKQAEGCVEELHQKLDISIELFNGQKIVEHMIKNKIAIIEKVTLENHVDEEYFRQFET